MKIKKLLIFFLSAIILLETIPCTVANAFNPSDFDEIAKQTFISNDDKSISAVDFYTHCIETKILEVKSDILSKKIPLRETDQDKKVYAFLKKYPEPKDWEKYPVFRNIVVSTLMNYIITDDLVKQSQDCFEATKDAMIKLINNDSSFSPEFKLLITNKIKEVKLYITGVSEPITNLKDFNIDNISIDNETGYLIGLNEWEEQIESKYYRYFNTNNISIDDEAEHPIGLNEWEEQRESEDFYDEEVTLYVDEAGHPIDLNEKSKDFSDEEATLYDEIYDRIFKFRNFYLLSYLCFPNSTMMISDSTININPSALITQYNKRDLQLGDLLFTFGHELTHYVVSHFIEYFISTYGCSMLGAMPTKDDSIVKGFCKTYNIPIDLDIDTIRQKAYTKVTTDGLDQSVKEFLESTTKQKDKDYMKKIYKELSNYFNNIDTKLIYPNTEIHKEKGVANKPVKLIGETCFNESIADTVGLKAALIASKALGINENSVYTGFANLVWEPQDLLQALGGEGKGPYPMSPYRIKVAYELSLRSPNTFGFWE